MLVVISPAKRLNEGATASLPTTVPIFQREASELAAVARKLSSARLQDLMAISENLAQLTATRFAAFQDDPAPDSTTAAARIFAGDTYLGLEAATLDPESLAWAQDHLRILSGLYGLLRPLDAIQPYRLEMGSRLRTGRGKSLYDFWGAQIADALNDAAASVGADVLLNCASVEYFGAVDPTALGLRVVTPVFMDDKPGGPRVVSFFAKKARGAMARFVVENRLTDPDAIKDFDTGGYRFQPAMSDGDQWVFLRRDTD